MFGARKLNRFTCLSWLLIAGIVLPASSAQAADPILKVTLLGTGGPEYSADRLGYSTLVEANNKRLLFDAGRGVTQRLYESRVDLKGVTKIFLTHLHNDHYEGLPNLWITPWFLLSRTEPLELWGPPGSIGMVEGMRKMFEHDLGHRTNLVFKREQLDITVHELKEGEVYEDDGVKVTAFPVEHADGNPAFGYRVDYHGHAVAISGDTTLNENVIKYGTNADLIVHNVVAYRDSLRSLPSYKPVTEKLTTPEQAAEIFGRAKPKLAVFSHIVKKGLSGPSGDKIIFERTRRAGYKGPLEIGRDRMVIIIADAIQVLQPKATEGLPDLDR